MLRVLGNKMGVGFDDYAIAHLHKRYGGHPLLTRMACSFIHHRLSEQAKVRPFSVGTSFLESQQEIIDDDIIFYCRHVVSELKQFYKDEYEMLEMLARGNVADFIELAAEPEWIRHLKSYGLIALNDAKKPEFKIPVIKRYVAAEAARREKTTDQRVLVPASGRPSWLSRRIVGILSDFRQLFKTAHEGNIWLPYNALSVPNAEYFMSLPLVETDEGLVNFLNVCYQAFIEPIGNNFFSKLKTEYPELFDALHRIRLYRHMKMHSKLDANVLANCDAYLKRDFSGKRLSQINEPQFAIQQVCLDELFVAIQFEINRLN